jgi:predicted alpha-1,2-mannosidase
MKSIPLLLVSLSLLVQAVTAKADDLASLVDPFVGTTRNGNTYPGAQVPFGMVQFSPNMGGFGYNYDQKRVRGFTVTLESGPGWYNGGSVLFSAETGPVKTEPGGYSFTFDHGDEKASAGYYQVRMQPADVNAELTATLHCGLAKFTFPAGKQADIVLPISVTNTETSASEVRWMDDRTLTGSVTYRLGQAGCGRISFTTVHFAMRFSRPFDGHGSWTDDVKTDGSKAVEQKVRNARIGYYVTFTPTPQPQEIRVSVGVSYVSDEGALANMRQELPDDDFSRHREAAAAAWNKELSLIQVQDDSLLHKRIFYTALYHTMLAPVVFDDVDGNYMGFDSQVHHVPQGHRHIYATYSGWDVYRSEIPLMALIEPDRAQDMAQSLVESYQQGGFLDRRPMLNRPTGAMNGSPMSICLVNIWQAGLHNFDIQTAYEGMMKLAIPTTIHNHVGPYEDTEQTGGVWLNADANVSTALEYDLSFAALGHLAMDLNKPEDANFLFGRALEYRTLFNPKTGFLQARDDQGKWVDPDEPKNSHVPSHYCEGNKWIYLWFVPEDIQGLADLVGGPDAFEKKLDEFFDKNHYDATNEPDIQAPFLYDYIGRPWKTQKIVAKTADAAFTDSPGGLAGGGNDDLGAMSAWYVFSQLGFYPVDPGVPAFEVCAPRFPKAILHLGSQPGAKVFTIEAPGASAANFYIQSATLNGQPLLKPWFYEEQILSGGEWNVPVGAQPNTDWGADPAGRPFSLSTGVE